MILPHLDWKDVSAFLAVASKVGGWLARPYHAVRGVWTRFRARPSRKVLLAQVAEFAAENTLLKLDNVTLKEQSAAAQSSLEIQKLHAQQQVPISAQQPQVTRLPVLQERLLILAADQQFVYEDTLQRSDSAHPDVSKFHLYELFAKRLIKHNSSGGGYYLNQAGTRYLLENDLIPEVKTPTAASPQAANSPRASVRSDHLRRQTINPAPGGSRTR